MKLLIVTRCDENIRGYTEFTIPMIERYANKCNAMFLKLDHKIEMEGDGSYHYRIMKCRELLECWDRVLHIDADVFIKKDCPNLFQVVPFEKIGTIYEDVGSRKKKRRKLIREIQEKFGDVGWQTGYINTGVFIASNLHKEIFTKIKGEYWVDTGWDDVHIGHQINRMKMKVFELEYKYNHMAMFSEEWNNNANALNSYIIHFAGGYNFPGKEEFGTKEEFMRNIYEKYRDLWI